jgi:hypothetical protein
MRDVQVLADASNKQGLQAGNRAESWCLCGHFIMGMLCLQLEWQHIST